MVCVLLGLGPCILDEAVSEEPLNFDSIFSRESTSG